MFSKFAKFWIEKGKITMIFIFVVLLWGIFSWLVLPKQYNPDIVVPAYNIVVPAPGFSANEVSQLVVKPLENKLFEIEGVEHVYGVSNKDYGAVMVTFYVGTDKEKATTRLYNKIMSNMDQKPLGVQDPVIKNIDPDDIPVYTFAITKQTSPLSAPPLTGEDKGGVDSTDSIKLKKVGLDIMDELKLVKNTSVFYLVGGEDDNINIKLNQQSMDAKNIDVMQVYDVLKKNNLSLPAGDLNIDGTKSLVSVDGNLNEVDKVKRLIISYQNNSPVYLEDIASVYKGVSKEKYKTFVSDFSGTQNGIFVGIAKKKGTNAVFVVEDIKEKLSEIQKDLPKDYKIVEVQDEGKTAEHATNKLLEELIKSIIILFIILTIFLGFKDALSSAFAIPLVLAITFGIALLIGDNVNRITLFALILVLGMLVDDSIIVVENISRHLEIREKQGKSILECILEAVNEIGVAAVFSTITKIMAFLGMFFVTGMMGQYMGPIPKYAIIALSVSVLIAFSVNPFFSYIFAKKFSKSKKHDKEENGIQKIEHELEDVLDRGTHMAKQTWIEKKYQVLMNKLLEPENGKLRKRFKTIFWITLGVVMVMPIALGIFKARMLPKSNQQQVYVWIDTAKNWDIQKTSELAQKVDEFLGEYKVDNSHREANKVSRGDLEIASSQSSSQGPSDLQIIESVNYTVGKSFVPDFANVFRGGMQRDGENYISMRINLNSTSDRNISSENFVIQLRPFLRKFVNDNAPDAKVRLLEDPPGPPVRATYMLEVSGNPDSEYSKLEEISDFVNGKLQDVLEKNNVEDVYTSKETYQTNYIIKLDHENISRLGLTVEQVAYSVYNMFDGNYVSIYHDEKTKQPINLYMSLDKTQKDSLGIFNQIYFTNNQGKKIFLSEISKLIPTETDHTVYSDDRLPTVYIYGEMGNNSVVYPMVTTINKFLDESFWEGKFEVEKWNLYGFIIKEKATGDKYFINFGGEWEVTMDTFRDLGTALIITLFGLYFMVSAWFKSFSIGGIIMLSFLLGFFGIMPGYSFLYLVSNEYFSATSMIGVIALAGIVVGNGIILLEYFEVLRERGLTLKMSLLHAGITRLRPIILTSLTAILGAAMIIGDPVWSGLAWSIIWGLSASAVLTLIVIPVFVFDSLNKIEKLKD